MKRKLLSMLLPAYVAFSGMALSPLPHHESTVLDPVTGRAEVVAQGYIFPSESASAITATDSVNLTVKWTLGSPADAELAFRVINKEFGFTIALSKQDIQKCTDKSMSFRLPKGEYALAFNFITATEEAIDRNKLEGLDNVILRSDTTITFNSARCTKKINYRFLLPGGVEPKLGYKGSGKVDYSGANIFKFNVTNTMYYKLPDGTNTLLSGMTYFADYNMAAAGNYRTRSADMLVNPDISAAYHSAAYVPMLPLDKDAGDRTSTEPICIAVLSTTLDVPDTTLTQDYTRYIDITPPAVKHSLFTPSAANPAPETFAEILFSSNINGLGMMMTHRTPGCLMKACIQPGVDLKFIMRPVLLETKSTMGFTVASGFGIALPKMYVQDDGALRYIMADNLGDGMAEILLDENNIASYRTLGHKSFTYSSMEQQPDFGNTAPVLSMPVHTMQSSAGYPYPFAMVLTPTWVANCGEVRDIDCMTVRCVTLADKDTLYKDFQSFKSGIASWSQKADNKGKRVTLVFDNRNFTVDDLPGHTHAELSYVNGAADICLPSLQMMQFRDADGRITNKFECLRDVRLTLAGGDFNWLNEGHYAYAPAVWKVEVAPRNADVWTELAVREKPDLFFMPVFGACYGYEFSDGELESDDGWFRMRLTLTDAAGNTSVQTVAPAFYAKNATSSVVTIDNDTDVALLADGASLRLSDGGEALFAVYSVDGRCLMTAMVSSIDLSVLQPGVYIATAMAGGRTLTKRFSITR